MTVRLGFDLTGKHILIVGAAGGIGGETAKACAAMGASLTLADLHEPVALAESLQSGGAKAQTRALNVTDRRQTESLIRDIGELDALVAAAGFCPWDDWRDADWDETFERVIDVNLLGTVHLLRAALPGMMARRRGKVVVVASVAGRMGGLRASPHYVAAKGGLLSFVRWAARLAADAGVNVNGVAPGATKTQMTDGQTFDVSAVPLGRMARPDEIAWPIAFLCSPASDYICGAVLDVNGGVFMN
jgi:NAD(P)-dependent dehydrogenase (short-subunit alcohol dehydrogenase family)